MSNSKTRYEVTHARILEVASRALRMEGYAAVGVADVMKRAGLTHGGFYAHFPSRDALLKDAVAHAAVDGREFIERRVRRRRDHGQGSLQALIEAYLSESHIDKVESGCVVAALASDMHRQSLEVRETSTRQIRGLIDLVKAALSPSGSDDDAMLIASTLVGTVQLARALENKLEKKALITATKHALISRYVES